MLKSPVVLLTFANGDDEQTLDLKKESGMLKDAFLLLEHEGLVNVEREESVTLKELETRLLNYYNDLVIFHYAGHANSTKLLLEGGAENGNKIAGMLGKAPHLQLVVLNACETKEQADLFLDQGVKAVIATSAPIKDPDAIKFSRILYENLSRKATIEAAFERALSYVQESSNSGSIHVRSFMAAANIDQGEEDEALWRLYTRDEKDLNWKIDIDVKTLLNLRRGSQNFLTKLLNGPWTHFNNLLTKNKEDLQYVNDFVKVRRQIPEKEGAENEPMSESFPGAMERLWAEEIPHTWLTGPHGSGRTGTMIMMWNRLLNPGKQEGKGPVPVYVNLRGYQGHEEGYILSYISRYYLEVAGVSEINEQEAFWRAAGSAMEVVEGRGTIPSVVLFLGGNFEEETSLGREIKALSEKPGIQIIFSRRKVNEEKNEFLKYHILEIQPLAREEIENIAQVHLSLFRPEIRELVSCSRLWKTLFMEMTSFMGLPMDLDNLHTFIDENQSYTFANEDIYHFRQNFTTPGEFLWNFFEAKLFDVTHASIEEDQGRVSLRFYRFFLRHFIPKLVFDLDHEGQREVSEDDLLDYLNQIGQYFFQPWFLKVFPEFRRNFKTYYLQNEGWVEESERLGVLADLFTQFSIFTKGFKTYSVNQPGKEFVHLYKVRTYVISNAYFRDFLLALHIWQDIKASLFKGNIPPTLKERKLNPRILVMLGEIDGIHKNSDNRLLLILLNRCRGIFDQKILGYTIWNILQVWNETNGYYLALSLSNLDLRGIPLYKLSKELSYEPYFLSSDLTQSLVNYEDIFQKKEGHVLDFCYSKDGQVIVTGESDGTIRVWDTEMMICYKILDQEEELSEQETKQKIYSVCITDHVSYIVSGSEDGKIRFWDQKSEKCLLELEAAGCHGGPVLSLALCAIDGEPEHKFWLVSSGTDKKIHLWTVDLEKSSAEIIETKETPRDAVRSVDLFIKENGQRMIIAGSWDSDVYLWDGKSEYSMSVMDQHVSRVHCVKFSPDGQYFASGSSDDTTIIFKTEDPNRRYKRLKGHNRGIESLYFKEILNDDGEKELHLVTAASGDKILIWNLSQITWEVSELDPNKMERQPNLSFHPLKDGTKRGLFEVDTRVLPLGFSKEVTCVSFSPVNGRIAYSSSDGRLRIWNLNKDGFSEEAILYNIYELHVQGCKFMNLHEKSNLFEKETAFIQEEIGEKEVTKKMLLRQYGAIMNKADEENWTKIVEKMKRR